MVVPVQIAVTLSAAAGSQAARAAALPISKAATAVEIKSPEAKSPFRSAGESFAAVAFPPVIPSAPKINK